MRWQRAASSEQVAAPAQPGWHWRAAAAGRGACAAAGKTRGCQVDSARCQPAAAEPANAADGIGSGGSGSLGPGAIAPICNRLGGMRQEGSGSNAEGMQSLESSRVAQWVAEEASPLRAALSTACPAALGMSAEEAKAAEPSGGAELAGKKTLEHFNECAAARRARIAVLGAAIPHCLGLLWKKKAGLPLNACWSMRAFSA